MAYNPDQPRDERGRWGDGGFGALAARAKAGPGEGFTVNPATGSDVTTGYAVGNETDSTVIEAASLSGADVQKFAEAHPNDMIGGWHDPGSGKVFLDPVQVLADRGAAEELGRTNNQIAIGDLAAYAAGRDGEIHIGGTGGV